MQPKDIMPAVDYFKAYLGHGPPPLAYLESYLNGQEFSPEASFSTMENSVRHVSLFPCGFPCVFRECLLMFARLLDRIHPAGSFSRLRDRYWSAS